MVDALHFARASNSALDADFLTRVRRLLQLPQAAQLQLEGIDDGSEGGCSIRYTITIPVKLIGSEYGIADGVTVDERAFARLSFDAGCRLISSRLDGIDERHLELVRDQVKKLAASGQIASTRPEATAAGHQPWYLEADAQGVKRMKRARMA